MSKSLAIRTKKSTHRQARARQSNSRGAAVLRAELERLCFTLDSLGDGLITTDTQQRITFFNQTAQQLTGWTSKDALGKKLDRVFRLINIHTRERIANPVSVALKQKRVINLSADTALVERDGTEYFISSSIAPIYNHASQITGAVLVFRDVTRLRQAEYALKEAQQFTASLIENSLDMIIAVDLERHIIEFNPAAERTFGYAKSEILGQDASILYADPAESDQARQITLNKESATIQVWNRRKNGEAFPALLSVSPLKNATGEIIGTMGVSRDISNLKRAEEQRIRSEQLAALGRMAAALAHEINNPLQAIRSTLDLVMDFPLPANEREANLAIIRQEIERLGQVTERILHFARPAPTLRRKISVAELIRQTLLLTNKHLQHLHIQVTHTIQDMPPILASPEQISQVFLNIILNAIEAAGDGGHIQIDARAENNWAIISFINDGPIISPKEMANMFDPFFTTKQDGSGLGLYIAQSITQQHHGTITVENIGRERGVKFTLRLPLLTSVLDWTV